MEALSEDIHFNIVVPLTPTHYHNNDNYRPDILDIAFMKGVALKLSRIETLQCLNSDHPPVLMRLDIALKKGVSLIRNCIEPLLCLVLNHLPILLRMGPLTGVCPKPTIKITNWKKVSAVLEKVNTPELNKILDDIESSN
ncbi:hypothetical protein EVAR_85154_1 [Eumeta japonica]|uniref:RNA-directed DNA polymerase from mobile element jockey n=1 Tax=Eumeta variegata TaxID=151549 RepID=A0A4C1XPN5_EUMVA|nr:hypothetical protein EVAR_85154_1 [Eumeta japonica]